MFNIAKSTGPDESLRSRLDFLCSFEIKFEALCCRVFTKLKSPHGSEVLNFLNFYERLHLGLFNADIKHC